MRIKLPGSYKNKKILLIILVFIIILIIMKNGFENKRNKKININFDTKIEKIN